MRVNNIKPIFGVPSFNDTIDSGSDFPIFNNEMSDGGSQIVEPVYLPPTNPIRIDNLGEFNSEELIDVVLPEQNSGQTILSQTTSGQTSGQTNSGQPAGTSSITEPITDSEPSATTDETKTYVGGGTTPDSNIIVNKPKRNYLMYGLVGLVGAYVIYKVFFDKKSQ